MGSAPEYITFTAKCYPQVSNKAADVDKRFVFARTPLAIIQGVNRGMPNIRNARVSQPRCFSGQGYSTSGIDPTSSSMSRISLTLAR